MTIQERAERLISLGEFCRNIDSTLLSNELIRQISAENPWFTNDTIKFAFKAWGEALSSENINSWINKYPKLKTSKGGKRVGVVMAGNIPMVGLHDLISVILSGNTFIGKLSSKDSLLPVFIKSILVGTSPLADKIQFTRERLTNIDAIIATGSDNSAKYFNYYFSKYPNIIRANRSSVAVIDSSTTDGELEKLADDIYMHWGLGCRNVSKLFVHNSIDISELISKFQKYSDCVKHNKYANNYDYNKAIFLMNRLEFKDNGHSLFIENSSYNSPIACIYYETFAEIADIEKRLSLDKEKLQCVVSNHRFDKNTVAFGDTQKPNLWEYADGIDTIDFLTNL